MILCDQIIRDQRTKKLTLVGCFNRILCPRFPTAHKNIDLYVALTDGCGEYTGRLCFTIENTGEVLMDAQGKFKLGDPLQVAEMHFGIGVLPLPAPGKYRMEFLCEGESLMARTFVAETPQKESAP